MLASSRTISGPYTTRWRSLSSLGGSSARQLVPLGMPLARRPLLPPTRGLFPRILCGDLQHDPRADKASKALIEPAHVVYSN